MTSAPPRHDRETLREIKAESMKAYARARQASIAAQCDLDVARAAGQQAFREARLKGGTQKDWNNARSRGRAAAERAMVDLAAAAAAGHEAARQVWLRYGYEKVPRVPPRPPELTEEEQVALLQSPEFHLRMMAKDRGCYLLINPSPTGRGPIVAFMSKKDGSVQMLAQGDTLAESLRALESYFALHNISAA